MCKDLMIVNVCVVAEEQMCPLWLSVFHKAASIMYFVLKFLPDASVSVIFIIENAELC